MLRERKRISEKDARIIFRQLVDAMGYCHERKIIHRDLKLENLMIKEKGQLHIVVTFIISPFFNFRWWILV